MWGRRSEPDLNNASKTLGVQKRRLYEVTKALEGVGLVKKKCKNEVQICGDHGLAAEHAGLHTELADLETEESRLDILIAQARLLYNEQHKDKKQAYISCKDIRSVRQFRDQTVLVIKAHADTQIHIPGSEHSHRMHIRSEKGRDRSTHLCRA